jgi:hypothetical protein
MTKRLNALESQIAELKLLTFQSASYTDSERKKGAPELARDYPLILMTGTKGLYYFHSELHQIDSLCKRHPDPLVEINPETAARLGISDGDGYRSNRPMQRSGSKQSSSTTSRPTSSTPSTHGGTRRRPRPTIAGRNRASTCSSGTTTLTRTRGRSR